MNTKVQSEKHPNSFSGCFVKIEKINSSKSYIIPYLYKVCPFDAVPLTPCVCAHKETSSHR